MKTLKPQYRKLSTLNNSVSNNYILINKDEEKYIIVPKTIIHILEKMQASNPEDLADERSLAADIFAVSMKYRHNTKDDKTFQFILKKLLNNRIFKDILQPDEIHNLKKFFSQCKPGYELKSEIIWANSFFKPIIT